MHEPGFSGDANAVPAHLLATNSGKPREVVVPY